MPPARKSIVDVGGRAVGFTNLDKVLWPRDGYTKGDLIAYYRAVAPQLLPYLQGRPLTVERFPNGIDGQTWWEKEKPKGMPDWIPTTRVNSGSNARGHVEFMLCNDEASLAYVANLAAVVLHVWYSHVPNLDVPDFILIDLDPFDCTLATLAKVALRFRSELEGIGLRGYVKTTGGTGLHVVIPLDPIYDYDTAKMFAELLARRVAGLEPERTTLERTIAKRRKGTVYLDYVQVGMGKTYVAPYSVRGRDGAPVSMPLGWADVEAMARKRAPETSREMLRWTIADVPALVAKHGDPWAVEGLTPQRLESALQNARSLWE